MPQPPTSSPPLAVTTDPPPPPRPPVAKLLRPQSVILLSGLLIFVGCYLVNGSAHAIQDELAPVLALLGLFTLYEACVLGAAVWLSARVGGPVVSLLCTLAVLLMVDLTFVFNELAIAHLPLGVAAAAFAVVTGVVKAGLVARITALRLVVADRVAIAVGLAAVFGLPLMLRAVSGTTGEWTTGLGTAAWWVVAAAVGAAGFAATRHTDAVEESPRPRLHHLLVLLPALSALAHLLAAHWVYHQSLTAAHAAPLLLALSVVLLIRAQPGTQARAVGQAAGLAAVFAGMTDPQIYSGAPEAWTTLSGWRALLLAAGVLYLGACVMRPTLGTAAASALGFGGAALGATPMQPVTRVVGAGEVTVQAVRELTPTSPLQWGFILIVGAFAALGVGAVWAGFARPPADNDAPPAPAPPR